MSLSLSNPEVRRRIAIGLAVNTVAFSLMMWGLIVGAFSVVDALVALVPSPGEPGVWASIVTWTLNSVGWLARIAAVVGAFFVGPVLFNLGASLVAPIFYGRIFSVARAASGAPGESELGAAALSRLVAVEIRRLVRFVALSALLLPLNLLPVVGSALYLVCQFTLAASTMGWDLLSHHFELHELDYKQQKAWLKTHRKLVLALGAGATALCAVPIVQLVFITTNVAAAGVLSARLDGAEPPSGEA